MSPAPKPHSHPTQLPTLIKLHKQSELSAAALNRYTEALKTRSPKSHIYYFNFKMD